MHRAPPMGGDRVCADGRMTVCIVAQQHIITPPSLAQERPAQLIVICNYSYALFFPFFFYRQLVNAGLLTVRDAGSWWLSVPGAGKFISHFIKGQNCDLYYSGFALILSSLFTSRMTPNGINEEYFL